MQEVNWLWYPYIPADNLSLLGAKGGGGKGLTCASLTATITKAGTWPNGSDFGHQKPGHVLWGETEDPREEVLKPRLVAAGADCSLVTFITPKGFAELDRRKFINDRGTKLIVLSPFLSFLEGPTEHKRRTRGPHDPREAARGYRRHWVRDTRRGAREQES